MATSYLIPLGLDPGQINTAPHKTAVAMADSDLDPKAFLKTVRDLSDKRQKEDNERYEQLEAQILQDREARFARKLGA